MIPDISVYEVVRDLSILAFLFYGLACIFSTKLVSEFERYRLPQYRVITGYLETFGALGLLVGIYSPWLTFFAATGLTGLMAGGVVVRIYIKDSALQTLPALSLFAMNFFLAINAFD